MNATKTILFRFENKSSKEVMQASMPYFPHKAVGGFYSGLYKRLKRALEPKSGFYLIVGKKWMVKQKSERTVISFNNGVGLDIPFDITPNDVKIIKHYLEGIKMALKN